LYTASVALTLPVLLDPSNPRTQLVTGTGGLGQGTSAQRVHAYQQGGEVREYAAGRERMVLTQSNSRQIPLVFKACTPAQRRLLVDVWPGRLLLFRDTYGTRVFGSYLAESVQHIPRASLGDVADIGITFQRLTFTDQV